MEISESFEIELDHNEYGKYANRYDYVVQTLIRKPNLNLQMIINKVCDDVLIMAPMTYL